MESYLYNKYLEKAVPILQNAFNYKNKNQLPVIKKVSLNMGLGEAVQNPKVIELANKQLSLISGQKTVTTRSKKSIAGFKLRQGMPIGCMVTLRKNRMWGFLDKLMYVSLPRVRDFRGISKNAFDGSGNYTLGLREQLIFPEIEFDKIDKIRGLNVSISTTAKTDKECFILLEALGFPFRK